jgi:hypothetical protein
VYTSIEGPEAAAYCRGRALLSNGSAKISFPEHFTLVVIPDTVTIQLTPRSADSKGLAMTDQSANDFSIRELFGGQGNYEFDYFAAGVRKGFENYQAVVPVDHSPLGHFIGPSVPEAMVREASPQSPPEPTAVAATAVVAGPVPAPQTPFEPLGPGDKPSPWGLL